MSGASLRLIRSKGKPARAQRHHRPDTAERLAAIRHDGNVAAIELLRPIRRRLLVESRAGFDILCHVMNRIETEVYAYVTGTTVEEVRDRTIGADD